jgi:hypothetical protein
VNGISGTDLIAKADDPLAEAQRHTNLPGGKEIGLLDWLTSNPDRNPGNYIVNRQGVVPIDHGSVAFSGEAPQSPFSDLHLGIEYTRYYDVASLKPQFTHAELAKVRIDLENIKGQFADKPEWFNSMMGRLDVLDRAIGLVTQSNE